MKIYTLIDDNDYVLGANYYEECPSNGVEDVLMESFIRAKYDRVNRVFYEGASNTEKQVRISEIDNYYTSKISELVSKHVEKKTMTGTPIPEDIFAQYEALKLECNLKIKEIDPSQSMAKPEVKNQK